MSDQRDLAYLPDLPSKPARPQAPADVVVVLGAPRSGAGAVAQLLAANGVRTPEGPTACAPGVERLGVQSFNQRVLEDLGSDWWAPPSIESVEVTADDLIGRAREFWPVRTDSVPGQPVLLADPRFSLMLPVWRRVLAPEALYVVCVRDPVAVARSLLNHHKLELPVGVALWEAYMVAGLRGLTRRRAVFVDVDALVADEDLRRVLVMQTQAATGMTESHDLVDTLDARLLTTGGGAHEHDEYLTTTQLALYRSLLRLPREIVSVSGLTHLRVPAASLRILDRHHRNTAQQARVAAELERLQRELAEAEAGLARQREDNENSADELRRGLADIEKLRAELVVAIPGDEELRLRTELDEARRHAERTQQRAAKLDAVVRRLADEVRERRAELERMTPLAAAGTALSEQLEEARRAANAAQAALEQKARDAEQMEARLLEAQQALNAERSQPREDHTVLVSQLRAEAELAHRAAARAAAETASVHALYSQAFESRSWRWTRFMRREGRAQAMAQSDNGDHPIRTAVVVHVFYPELWAGLKQQLSNLNQQQFDLFVSVTDGHANGVVDDIRSSFPHSELRLVPNRGRDIAPLFGFLNDGVLDHHTAVLKLHTKRSRHRADGDEWRAALWHGLLPSPAHARRFAELVSLDPEVGCLLPAGNVRDAGSIGSNAERVTALLSRVGVPFKVDELEFPAGSMYWMKAAFLLRLRALNLDPMKDFEEECGQTDGTTAHAVERVIGMLLKDAGATIVSAESVRAEAAAPVAPS